MTAAKPVTQPVTDDQVFDDGDALIELAQRSFTTAARAAVAENDRLGIPTHGAVKGKLVVRKPRTSGPR